MDTEVVLNITIFCNFAEFLESIRKWEEKRHTLFR